MTGCALAAWDRALQENSNELHLEKSTMSTTNVNGRVRKSLAEQIDRLDQILDGLADGLNEAVAMVVKEAVSVAVKESVKAVLTEVLTNPDILEKVRGVATPVVPPVNNAPEPRLRGRLACLGGWLAKQARSAYQAASNLLNRGRAACSKLYMKARSACTSSWGCVRILRRLRVQLLTAVGVGVAAGTAAFLAGPWLAAVVSSAGVFTASLAVHAGFWLRQMMPWAFGGRPAPVPESACAGAIRCPA
jgi:hypothetical protein